MKNMKRIVSLLMTLMLICSSAVSSAATISSSAAIQVRTTSSMANANLNNFLDEVKIIDKTTNQEVTGQLETGKNYKIRLQFREGSRDKQFQINSDGKMVYTFPEGLKVSDLDGQYPLLVDGRQIGTYTIANNQLTFTPWYSSDKLNYHEGCKDPANEKTYADWAVNTQLWFDVTGEFTATNNQFNFGSKVNKTWKIVSPNETPQTELQKTATYNETTKTLRYTLTAKVTNSDADKLELSDILKDTTYVQGIRKDTLTIKKNGADYTLTENDALSWKEKTTEDADYKQGFDLTLKNVKKDDSYVIEYDVPIDEAKLNEAQLGTTGNVTVGKNTFSGRANNGDNREVEWSKSFPGKKPVNKSSGTADTFDKTILNWKLTVGSPNETDTTNKINGKQLTDTWTYDPTITGVSLVEDNITVTLYDFNGQTRTLTGEQAKACFTEKTESGFKFNVPNPSDFDVKYCTVDYKTKCTMTEDAANNNQTGNVYNGADFDKSHADGSGTAGGKGEVYLPDMSTSKSVEDLGGVLHYTITVQVPKEYIDQQAFWLEDRLCWTGDNGYFDYWIYNNPDNLKVTARGESGDPKDVKTIENGEGDYCYCFVKGTQNENAYFYLYFNATNKDDPSNTCGPWKWEKDEDVTLTIEYDISKEARVSKYNNGGWSYPDDYPKTINDLTNGIIRNTSTIHAKKDFSASADLDITRKVVKTATPEGNDGMRIRYKVDLNRTGLTPIPAGATFTDVYDEHMEVESIVAHIMWDNHGNEQEVTDIQCPSQTEADKAKHTINFTFGPFGSTAGWGSGTVHVPYRLEQIYGVKDAAGNWVTAESLYRAASDWYRHPYTDGGVTKAPWIRIEYVLKVKDEYINGQSFWITNTARISGWNEAKTTTSLTPKIIDKTMTTDAANKMLLFTINVNPGAQQLSDGTLTLEDSMTNLIPILDEALTVKDVTNSNDVKTLTRGTEWNVTYDSAKDRLVFTLPDGKALKIQYHAVVKDADNNHNGTASFSNTAELLGQRSEHGENKFDVTKTFGGGSSYRYGFYINKVAVGTNEALEGAKFRVTWYHWNDTEKNAKENGFGDFTTNQYGLAEILEGDHEDLGAHKLLFPYTVYCLEEIEPPKGCQKTSQKWYFYIEDTQVSDTNHISDVLAWLGKQGIAPQTVLNNNRFVIENEPAPQTVDFAFTKTGEGGAALGGAVFTLTESGTENTLTQTGAADGRVSFSGLEPNKTYILRETQAPDGYNRSTETWTVAVAADGTITVTDEKGNAIASPYSFGNRKLPNLPSVGGNGTTAYALFGLALMAAATAAAYALARKRKGVTP